MKDVQSQRDDRQIDIHKVGVKDIFYPITVLDKANKLQRTVARVNMYVNLPHQFKGTHMSRFVEILNKFHGNINLQSFHLILYEIKNRLNAESAHIEIDFPYFPKKSSASARTVNISEYRCHMYGSLGKIDDMRLGIEVPIPSPLLAPVADGLPRSLGRWGKAQVNIRFRRFIWIEDLIQLVEEVTSYNLSSPQEECLPPEKSLSVEMLTKAIAEKLATHQDIAWFSVEVENLFPDYSTYADIEWPE